MIDARRLLPPDPGLVAMTLWVCRVVKHQRAIYWVLGGCSMRMLRFGAIGLLLTLLVACGGNDNAATTAAQSTAAVTSASSTAVPPVKDTVESAPATSAVVPSSAATKGKLQTDVAGQCDDVKSTITVTFGPDVSPLSGILVVLYFDGEKALGQADTGRVLMSPGVNKFTVPTPATVAEIWRAPGAKPNCSVETSDLRVATQADLAMTAAPTAGETAPRTSPPIQWWQWI